MPTPVVAGFRWRPSAVGDVLSALALEPVAPHFFTTRARSFRGTTAAGDFRQLQETAGCEVVRIAQVHGRRVVVVRADDRLDGLPEADAIVSLDPSRAVAVQVADCVPILLADRKRRAVAAIHAGWRGTCAGIVTAVIEALEDAGVPATDIVAAIGPGIGPCCYQVDDRVRNAFLAMTPDAVQWFAEDGLGFWRLDLWRANADQLVTAGVATGAISHSRFCTADHLDVCFSYRKEGPATGRMLAVIGPLTE